MRWSVHAAILGTLAITANGFVTFSFRSQSANTQHDSSSTTLWKIKRIECETHDGQFFTATISSSKSFDAFKQDNGVKYLLNDNERIFEFSRLEDGGKYSLPEQADYGTAAPMPTTTLADRQEAVKTFFYVDASGNQRSAELGSREDLTDLLKENKARCLCNKKGRPIYFSRIANGATYSLDLLEDDRVSPIPAKDKSSFDFSTLPPPEDVILTRVRKKDPEFVCEDGWMKQVLDKVTPEFLTDDDSRPGNRVRPLALVGCTRSGKSRALKEIARQLKKYLPGITKKPVCIIMVTLNDYSSVRPEDEKDVQEAILRRIAFEAQDRQTLRPRKSVRYTSFCEKNLRYDVKGLEKWLGDKQAILIIDELNNLPSTKPGENPEAKTLGMFLRNKFLDYPGRHLIFSTHVLATLEYFVDLVDGPGASERRIEVQMLPLIPSLVVAREKLDKDLEARDAIFYGMLSGLIFTKEKNTPKQNTAMRSIWKLGKAKKLESLQKILRSLVTGDIDDVPEPLHILLTARSVEDEYKVSWIPFMLEKLLSKLFPLVDSRPHTAPEKAIDNLLGLSRNLASLLQTFKTAQTESGAPWEALFVFQLLSRCIASLDDGVFVPSHWFERGCLVEYNKAERLSKPLSEYLDLETLMSDIKLTKTKTIYIFYPGNNFKQYDAIALMWENNQLNDFYGYQLKTGSKKPKQKQKVSEKMLRKKYQIKGLIRNFWINGDPNTSKTNPRGWEFVSEEAISVFFGESGRFWTPVNWIALRDGKKLNLLH